MVHKQTAKAIQSKGPDSLSPYLMTNDPQAFSATSITDGDYTIVYLNLHGEAFAMGVSKRHPRDRHNRNLGMALALTRAFTDAAQKYAQTYQSMVEPNRDPNGVESDMYARKFRQANRAAAKVKWDERRAEARRKFREVNGWDHTDRPLHIAFDHELRKSIADRLRERGE